MELVADLDYGSGHDDLLAPTQYALPLRINVT